MSKYIKLEDAIHNINLEVTGRKEYAGDMKANLFFALDDLPTIDIVRCKDCKHYHASKHYAYCTVINVKGKHPQPNDYCSYAEEK